jgi:hypothetical protein
VFVYVDLPKALDGELFWHLFKIIYKKFRIMKQKKIDELFVFVTLSNAIEAGKIETHIFLPAFTILVHKWASNCLI